MGHRVDKGPKGQRQNAPWQILDSKGNFLSYECFSEKYKCQTNQSTLKSKLLEYIHLIKAIYQPITPQLLLIK